MQKRIKAWLLAKGELKMCVRKEDTNTTQFKKQRDRVCEAGKEDTRAREKADFHPLL